MTLGATGVGTGHPRGGPVPGVVHAGDETVVVGRAWPSVRVEADGGRIIRIEGHDRDGRLRAGRLVVSGPPGAPRHDVVLNRPGHDRKLPALEAVAGRGTLVVHRLGRRAVVRHDDRFVKVLRPGSSDAVAHRSRVGARIAASAGFVAAEVLDAGPGRIEFAVVPGQDLHSAGASMDLASWADAWDAWADAWPAFARADASPERPPAHTAADELTGLVTWLDHTHAFAALPRLQRELVLRCRALGDELAATEPDAPVVSHRDLHDKQLLWDGRRAGLLDLDTLALAEPALDLANLAVHAELRTHQGLWSRHHRDVVLERVERVADDLAVQPRRMRAYAEATRLRLTMLYAFRPRWAPLMADWLHERSLTAVSST
ncbi:hypothetical protein GA707_06190 [Nostocoides sp. F2B08]|uniref:hypothetical protein n=1 Tax=Nostocoides sp. F2B08 TaxID=2653936 RepID=UPI001262CEC8|nr:hypothetical protein [Tetrasphaera sp. F2B08]KAB7745505.1 hypothetical protein GA707_06190 [Tetrasphaera sp. F2B08]